MEKQATKTKENKTVSFPFRIKLSVSLKGGLHSVLYCGLLYLVCGTRESSSLCKGESSKTVLV